MIEEISCYVCGHPINNHESGCNHQIEDFPGICTCTLTPQDIAAYAVAQAYEQGRMDYGGGDVEALLLCVDVCNTDPAHIAKAQP